MAGYWLNNIFTILDTDMFQAVGEFDIESVLSSTSP